MRMLTGLAGSITRSPKVSLDLACVGTSRISIQQLASLMEQIECVTRTAEDLVAGRDRTDLTTRLTSDSWTVAECFDHLAQTTRAFLPAMSDSLAVAPKLTSGRPLRTGFLARLFLRNLEPPYRIRIKVLPQLIPQQQDFDSAWRGFLESQAQLSETIRAAAGLAIDQVKIKSPVYARVHYNLYGAFRMLVAHERRHIWQIQKLLTALDRRVA